MSSARPTTFDMRARVRPQGHGDGSSEAFTGRVRRTLVEQRKRESAVDALRRVLA